MNANHLLQSARGNWPAILLAAGVPDRFLTGKHGPCPFCGGKDRYRFTDFQQRGGFICSRCNPDGGDGLALLMQWRGDDFKQALAWLADYLRLPSEAVAVTRQTLAILRNELSQAEIEQRLFKLGKLWSRSAALTGDCIGSRYLKHRGVLDESNMPDLLALRFVAELDYYTGRAKTGTYPALLAAVTAPDGRKHCAHRYLHLHAAACAGHHPRRRWAQLRALAQAERHVEPLERMGDANGAAVGRRYRVAQHVAGYGRRA